MWPHILSCTSASDFSILSFLCSLFRAERKWKRGGVSFHTWLTTSKNLGWLVICVKNLKGFVFTGVEIRRLVTILEWSYTLPASKTAWDCSKAEIQQLFPITLSSFLLMGLSSWLFVYVYRGPERATSTESHMRTISISYHICWLPCCIQESGVLHWRKSNIKITLKDPRIWPTCNLPRYHFHFPTQLSPFHRTIRRIDKGAQK